MRLIRVVVMPIGHTLQAVLLRCAITQIVEPVIRPIVLRSVEYLLACRSWADERFEHQVMNVLGDVSLTVRQVDLAVTLRANVLALDVPSLIGSDPSAIRDAVQTGPAFDWEPSFSLSANVSYVGVC